MKKRLFISSILMTLVLLVAITTATFAWYTATTAGGSVASTSSYGTITTTGQTVQLGGIEFEFDVKVGGSNSASVYLGTSDNATATKAVYKLWNPAKTELLTYDVADSGTGQEVYSSYFKAVTISITAIKLNSVDIKGTASALNPYAGTYSFKLTCNAQGILASAAPTSSKTLGDLYNTTTQELAFTVIIPSSGTTLSGTFSTGTFIVAVEGQDGDGFKTASETTALGVTYVSYSAS